MKIIQAPRGLTDTLPEYPFESRFISVPIDPGTDSSETLRIHYIEAGPKDGQPVVFLHGNPSWSYLWRRSIQATAALGFRAIALDLVGMGLSDRPSELADYTVARHVAWTRSALILGLDLENMILVLHDWGGILGLRVLALHPDRIAGVAISNTGLPERDPGEPLPEGPIEASGPFAAFQKMAREAEVWEPWNLLPMVMVTPITDEVRAGYRTPYGEGHPALGSQSFPGLLPTRPDNPMLPDNWEAWKTVERFEKPFVTIFSDKDIIAPDGWKPLVARIPGAKGQPHVILEGGGHFLQEDIPEAYNEALLGWLRDQF